MKMLSNYRMVGLTPGLFLTFLLTLLLAGCASPDSRPMNPAIVATAPGNSAMGNEAVPADMLEYAENAPLARTGRAAVPQNPPMADPIVATGEQVGTVRPGLNLRITVLVAGQPEFNEPSRQVSAQGNLDVPLIGKVQVAGLTLQQVEVRLTERFTQYLVEPQVVVEYVHSEGSSISPWGYVTVLGRVRSPGKLPIPPTRDLTVSGAIQQAGGYDTSARSSSIRVTRQLANDKIQRLRVDLKAYAKGDLEEDIVLKAGDVIFVPESPW